MITELHVKGFRSLRDVALTLEPLTVLVGPNGSGKTSLLDILQPVLRVETSDFWRHAHVQIERQARVAGQHHVAAASRTVPHLSGPWSVQRFDLRPDALRSVQAISPQASLNETGSNLTNVIESLGRRRQEELSKRLCELVPLFSDVDVLPTSKAKGAKEIVFYDRWEPGLRYLPDQVSDGTMLVLAFLTLGYVGQAPDLITVESPESSLHPYLLGQVIDLLRKLSEGRLGPKATQVVIATHSAALLDFVRPEEVRFVSRDLKTGETSVSAAPTDTDEFREAWEEYDESLGELWLSGGLGGVPAPSDGG